MLESPTVGDHFYPYGDFRAKVLMAMIRHRWFIRTRWLFAAAVLIFFIVEKAFDAGSARTAAVGLMAFVLAGVNLAWTAVGKRLTHEASERETLPEGLMTRVTWFVNAQMVVDLLLLTLLLRYSGGVENPMLMFYLFHVLIAALLLRPINALIQGLWALLLFGGLAAGQCAGMLGHDAFLPTSSGQPHSDWMFALAATAVLAAGVFGTLFFTVQISSRLDEQERRLRSMIDALERSRDAIQDLQARRSRFMLTAAHQLKSPLAGVQTLSGLIYDGVVPEESVRPTCARIMQRCRDAIQQVGELLTLSRIQDAPPRRTADSTDVREVLSELIQRYEPIAADKEVEFVVETPEYAPLVAAVDSANFADCIGNLIDNAIKYTPAGGRVSVTARTCRRRDDSTRRKTTPLGGDRLANADSVCIEVADTGIGIEPNALAAATDPDGEGSVFDAFLRGDNALAAGITGSGLGLAIVREVVEQAGGKITVSSYPGTGTTFGVLFPCPRSVEQDAEDTDIPDTRFSVEVINPVSREV